MLYKHFTKRKILKCLEIDNLMVFLNSRVFARQVSEACSCKARSGPCPFGATVRCEAASIPTHLPQDMSRGTPFQSAIPIVFQVIFYVMQPSLFGFSLLLGPCTMHSKPVWVFHCWFPFRLHSLTNCGYVNRDLIGSTVF